jgi:predicted N-acetyltransferase YhbS
MSPKTDRLEVRVTPQHREQIRAAAETVSESTSVFIHQWLVHSARRADRQDTARTYVWTAPDRHRVVAYFATAPTQVNREDDGLSGGASGGLDRISAFLIAKLAVDESIADGGNGRQLVLDAISRIVEAAS